MMLQNLLKYGVPLMLALSIVTPLSAAIYAPTKGYEKYVRGTWESLPTSEYDLYIEPTSQFVAFADHPPGQKPQVHMSIGVIHKVEPDEFRFMLSHEVGHLVHRHVEGMALRMALLEETPFTLSGVTFLCMGFKWDENQADSIGKAMYLSMGGDPRLFSRMADRNDKGIGACKNTCTSLSPFDSHFSFTDRFERLQGGQWTHS